MSRPTVLRVAALAVAVTFLAATARAQLRLTRPVPWTPDSVVKSILTGSSAQLTPNPPIDPSIPRIWLTRAERSLWTQTSDYEEMMRYCRSLEAGSHWVKLEIIGKSGQGRDLPMLILSKDRAFTPDAARALGKPVILIQNGIHAGEIEGKDASLMLMRDMAALHKYDALLDSVTLLVLPTFSVDAAERRSHWNRINQNGPDEMGWRHTPVGLNLNRDYTKLDAPEMRACKLDGRELPLCDQVGRLGNRQDFGHCGPLSSISRAGQRSWRARPRPGARRLPAPAPSSPRRAERSR